MKNLQALAAQCRTELASIGIFCGKVNRWTVNTRAKTRWGLCKKLTDGSFEIEISVMLLQDSVSARAAKESCCTPYPAAMVIPVSGNCWQHW